MVVDGTAVETASSEALIMVIDGTTVAKSGTKCRNVCNQTGSEAVIGDWRGQERDDASSHTRKQETSYAQAFNAQVLMMNFADSSENRDVREDCVVQQFLQARKDGTERPQRTISSWNMFLKRRSRI